MLRMIAVILLLSSPAAAQVAATNDALQQQLAPDSLSLEGNAIASSDGVWWRTSATYAFANNSGMNLYMSFITGTAALGSCTDLREVRGAFSGSRLADNAFSQEAVLVPAGAKVGGTLVFFECRAPNPGSATAQLSMTLLLSLTQARPSVRLPIAVEVPVRQTQPQ